MMKPDSTTNDSAHRRITDWPEDERPREKLERIGAESMSHAELMAILLGQGTARMNAVDLARALLKKFGTLEAIAGATLTELQEVPGIGPAKAVTLAAAFQLGRNMQSEAARKEQKQFTNPRLIAEIYIPRLGHLKKEHFWVLLLDTAMKLIREVEVTSGLLNASLVHPREVFNPAIRFNARGIIVMHNHPSGQKQASDEDIRITHTLVESGKLLDIPVYDHIIIAGNGYYSFKENHLI
ncbi:MAG: JAB domain-containing protein [Calditrichaeota bacterium]|nr:MAG: JAB domain-containing protein [Calditrichota bacterium]